jgi:hypothetical protein
MRNRQMKITVNQYISALMAMTLGASTAMGGIADHGIKSKYVQELKSMESEITKALPTAGGSQKSAYDSAREAEAEAKQKLEAAQKRSGEIAAAKALVDHAKGKWIGGAQKGIKQAEAKIKAAKNDEERQAAEKELKNWQQNLKDGEEALAERLEKYEAVKDDGPKIAKEIERAKEALAEAKEEVVKATENLGLDKFLESDAYDGRLAKFVALKRGTPEALAEYASQGAAHKKRMDDMLADEDLLIQIAVADGPRTQQPGRGVQPMPPNYGRAMEIYESIQESTESASEGVLQRLALAVALEHAVPHKQRNAEADTESPAYVDPLKRYLHFEKAYLANELDPGFRQLTVWDMRHVVNGEEPEAILAWGREMLRNYRPDHITTDDYRWRYVGLVRTDIRYGSDENKYDRDDLQFFQNILMNGGICGRRAFIGRFILRAFGIPTIARPQKGHAALAHWTPSGWVVCLGAGWGNGWTKTAYKDDLDFLATTQARALGDYYLRVKRAQWIGDLLEENRVYGLLSAPKTKGDEPEIGFWNGVALNTQRALIEDNDIKTLAAVGEELGEANESDVVYAIKTAPVTKEDRKITINEKGVIHIPAVATTKPQYSTGNIKFFPSTLGGLQLNYGRGGNSEEFVYTFDSPVKGRYALTARVATPSWKQNLIMSLNDAEKSSTIPLPHTVGLWAETEPVEIELVDGENELRFTRSSSGVHPKGFAIHSFTLRPLEKVALNVSMFR